MYIDEGTNKPFKIKIKEVLFKPEMITEQNKLNNTFEIDKNQTINRSDNFKLNVKLTKTNKT
jgi:hypothetical protein